MTSSSGRCRHELRWVGLGTAIVITAAGCAPTHAPPTPTPLAPTTAPSPTASATPFPTAPPSASATHTPDPRNSLFQDDFSRDRGWQLRQGPTGAVSILEQRLVISVRGPSALLSTLSPASEVADFVLEVVARSEICDNGDEFGLLARTQSQETHYRFMLSCDGAVRASRFADGREAALAPIAASEAVFSGAPAVNRLRLEAIGDQFRFWVNDIQVLEVTDSQIASGGSGLIVRARRSSQTTIAFDDFALWAAPQD